MGYGRRWRGDGVHASCHAARACRRRFTDTVRQSGRIRPPDGPERGTQPRPPSRVATRRAEGMEDYWATLTGRWRKAMQGRTGPSFADRLFDVIVADIR